MLFAIHTQKGRCKRMMQFKVEKLFGRFNYDMQLNKEGLTILTGPNGFGKSTIFTKDVCYLLENRPFLPKTLKTFQMQLFVL